MLHYFLGIEVLQNDECISYLKRSMQKIIWRNLEWLMANQLQPP
jgi:hypothetical protein